MMISAVVLQSGGELLKLGALGVALVLLFVGGIYWLAARDVFSPSEENAGSAQERAADEELRQRGGFEIPLRSKIAAIGGPGKSVFAAILLITGFVGYLAYKMAQTGSPAEEYISANVVIGAVALVGILGGARLQQWADSRVGRLYNIYESEEGSPDVERVEFYKHEQTEIGSDSVIQQLHPQALLGLFRRRLLVGQHRKLRSSAKPLSDVVSHVVPEGEHCMEVDNGIFVNLTRGEPIYLHSADAAGDVAYRSPNNLSYERALQKEHIKRRALQERDAWRATAAAKDAEIDRLSDMIINREWQDKSELMDLLREYEEMQHKRSQTVVDNREGGVSRSAGASGTSVLEEERKRRENGEMEESH